VRFGEAFGAAVDALRANRLRSALTMLGVIIGVAAVVMLVAIGSGAKAEVEAQVEGLGSNLILVFPGSGSFGAAPAISQLSLDDVDLLGRIVGDSTLVAATTTSSSEVRVGGKVTYVTVNGTNENVPIVFDRPVTRGRYISKVDVDTRRRVVVLGPDTAHALFGDVEPLGRQVSIRGVRFRVIGVFTSVGSAFGINRDTEIHIPVTAAQRLYGVTRIDALAVRAPTIDGIPALQDALLVGLRDKYPGEKFSAVTQTQILGAVGTILGLLTLVLAAIAGISLFVGGVGVSNIMLVSVRERTREIGLRKALGARQRDILVQFLIEAVLLTTIGGVIGIGIGVGASLLGHAIVPDLPVQVAWWSIALAFGVSVAVGVFFGVFPARRAGRLDPVVALRTE